jgi:hypothetical protein
MGDGGAAAGYGPAWIGHRGPGRRPRTDADGLMHLVGQPHHLLGQMSVVRKYLEVLPGRRSFTAQHLGLARLEVMPAPNLGGVVLCRAAAADLVAFGLAGLVGKQNQQAA